MTLLDAAPLSATKLQGLVHPARRGNALWAPADSAPALSLFTVWAARTGRMLRAVPIAALTPEELVDFWADDQLEALTTASGEVRP